jgi:hypothetical protein
MKVRFKGNSIRVRVSSSELARIQAGTRIEETVHFPEPPEATLIYALEAVRQAPDVTIRYDDREVTVIISEDQARNWGSGSQLGVHTSLDLGAAGSIEVIVEKDSAGLSCGKKSQLC